MLTTMDQQLSSTVQNGEFDERTRRRSVRDIITLDSSHMSYTLVWSGWGHTGRVWDVTFVSALSYHQPDIAFPLLLSAGEDGAARVWSPLSSTKEITHQFRGHCCDSIWAVNVCEGIVVTGGNDGCVNLFELEGRLNLIEKRTCLVPNDSLSTVLVINNGVSGVDPRPVEIVETGDEANTVLDRKKNKNGTQHNNVLAICGMVFYSVCGSVQSNLLIATRGGSLFSLDLTSNAWSDRMNWSEDVVYSVDDETVDINPLTGSHVGVHPSGNCAVIGTTEGWLVISSLATTSTNKRTNVAFCAQPYRPVQSVTFIDKCSLLVFYARGATIWFKFDQSPAPLHVMKLGTTGIPLSFANDSNSMYIGDLRGNIAFFALNKACPAADIDPAAVDVHKRKPNCLLTKVHGKEHVTGLAIITSTGVLLSIGNDSCLHQCKMDTNGQLQKLISIPVPHVTGLRHI